MKILASLTVILATYSLGGWADQVDFNKRNAHIFCASHLAVISESADQGSQEYQALRYLSGMHRKEAKAMGATRKHFSDVIRYLENVRDSDKTKWQSLSTRSQEVCLND
ncbi:hypothetical protein SAMN04487880_1920 [Marinobacter sp. es.042]|uniref:hypothetical protein n=1 Tax=Marinobacter sp. es.042 TaxID=1761794 RepID=UPI000B502297|nr:hypothetical protein [Marinobacter sp. es.042]SNB57032.1 hypothetical protein SAMN04487880_1920 [Marinobacter sp. es.042]